MAGCTGRSRGERGAEGTAASLWAVGAADPTEEKSSINRRICLVSGLGLEIRPLQNLVAVPSLSSAPSSVPIAALLQDPGRRRMAAEGEEPFLQSGAAAALSHIQLQGTEKLGRNGNQTPPDLKTFQRVPVAAISHAGPLRPAGPHCCWHGSHQARSL